MSRKTRRKLLGKRPDWEQRCRERELQQLLRELRVLRSAQPDDDYPSDYPLTQEN